MSVINTNISSMQAQSSVRTSGLNLSTAMERLSSGVRINSAKDDAAGLAISTRMTASIRGISAAIRNANDGISLTQTAEGSLGQISDNLQRIRELAVQSANTGNSASDRAAMNNEAGQLIAEIDRVAANTSYNGIALLDGTFQAQNLQVGAGSGTNDRIAISIDSAASTALGVGLNSNYSVGGSTTVAGALAANGLSINAVAVGASSSDGVSYTDDDASGIAIAAAINAVSGTSGVTATVGETTLINSNSLAGTAMLQTAGSSFAAITAGDIVINGVSIGAVTITAASTVVGTAATTHGGKVVTAINLLSADTGVTATYSATSGVTLSNTDGSDIKVQITNTRALTANTGITGFASAIGTNTTALSAITGQATDIAAGAVLINGVDIGAISGAGSAAERGGQVAAAVNAVSSQTGVTATFSTSMGRVSLAAADGRNITVTFATGVTTNITGIEGTAAKSETTSSAITLSSSGSDGITIGDLDGSSATASGLTVGYTAASTSIGTGVSGIDLTTASSSQDALTTLDLAIDTITDSRAAMGAYQNRLTASIANLETTSMNLSASRSRILDTDYAKETTNLAKSQIIQQAATAMLAQANQSGQSVLALLK